MAEVPKAAIDKTILVIACGALARELVAIVAVNRLDHLKIACLPAILHNRPETIAPAVRRKIRENRTRYDTILCLYGDCGTGGDLDRVLDEEGVERIPGAHCYEFFAGAARFAAITDPDPGVFFLTDYLVRHFERLVIQGLGLDRFPQLRDTYFGNYNRVVYLAQVDDGGLRAKAEAAAARIGLRCETRVTGLDGLADFVLPRARPASASAQTLADAA